MRSVLAQVGEPVPGEHALAPTTRPSRKGSTASRKASGAGGQVAVEDGLARCVEDVGEQAPGVQIDAAVESVRLVVAAHAHGLRGDGPS